MSQKRRKVHHLATPLPRVMSLDYNRSVRRPNAPTGLIRHPSLSSANTTCMILASECTECRPTFRNASPQKEEERSRQKKERKRRKEEEWVRQGEEQKRAGKQQLEEWAAKNEQKQSLCVAKGFIEDSGLRRMDPRSSTRVDVGTHRSCTAHFEQESLDRVEKKSKDNVHDF